MAKPGKAKHRYIDCPAGCGRKMFKTSELCSECSRAERKRKAENAKIPEQELNVSIEPNRILIDCVDADINTVDKAVTKAGVDLDRWRIAKQRIKTYQMGMKVKRGENTEDPVKMQLHSITVELVPRVKLVFDDALKLVAKRLKGVRAPTPGNMVCKKCTAADLRRRRVGLPKGDALQVTFLTDHHFGKYCWTIETGMGDYDLDIATKLWNAAVDESVQHAKDRKVKHILLPIGSDLANFDNVQQTTTSGTNVDNDDRWAKVYATIMDACEYAVNQHRRVAPVTVMQVGGNHDEMASWWTVEMLRRVYRGTKDVTVDASPKARKAFRWGCTLLGLAHGHDVKLDRLPYLMREWRKDYAECRFAEWLTGHNERRKKIEWVATDEFEGVVVRVVPALCPPTKWHYLHGFVGMQGAESYFYSKSQGPVGMVPLGLAAAKAAGGR